MDGSLHSSQPAPGDSVPLQRIPGLDVAGCERLVDLGPRSSVVRRHIPPNRIVASNAKRAGRTSSNPQPCDWSPGADQLLRGAAPPLGCDESTFRPEAARRIIKVCLSFHSEGSQTMGLLDKEPDENAPKEAASRDDRQAFCPSSAVQRRHGPRCPHHARRTGPGRQGHRRPGRADAGHA